MKLCRPDGEETFTAELVVNHPPDVPGLFALKRTDTGKIITMRDVMGVPGFSAPKYHLLEVTATERAELARRGITIAETVEDYLNWYCNWDGPKATGD